MADSMVEAVARAISHECPNGCEAAGEIDACRPDLCDCRRIARAAIAATREPSEAATQHEYPSNYGPGVHWASDAAWEILDTIKPGVISMEVRCLLAGQIAGRLMHG